MEKKYNKGDIINGLIFLEEVQSYVTPSGKKSHKRGKFKCYCGETFITKMTSVRTKRTLSCGCRMRKFSSELGNMGTHGLTLHPLYKKWISMKSRCHNPKAKSYSFYGGKGIEVCEEWRHNFQAFYDWSIINNWKEGLSIDRIDSDGNYEPSNCRYITQDENLRRSKL